MYMYAYYIHTVRHIHAVCINVYMIMFNGYIMVLALFDGYASAATLFTDRLRITLILITGSCY